MWPHARWEWFSVSCAIPVPGSSRRQVRERHVGRCARTRSANISTAGKPRTVRIRIVTQSTLLHTRCKLQREIRRSCRYTCYRWAGPIAAHFYQYSFKYQQREPYYITGLNNSGKVSWRNRKAGAGLGDILTCSSSLSSAAVVVSSSSNPLSSLSRISSIS